MMHIALLRGINVGGHRKIPMAGLRSVCGRLGWTGVRTYIQSGNILFNASGSPADLENALERAIEQHFGFDVSVVIRTAAEWPRYVTDDPFPDASAAEPKLVMLALSKSPPKADAVEGLLARAVDGERIVRVGDALYIHFPNGAGTSKLSPALLDRLVGSPVTMRNWRTVLTLHEMLETASSAGE